MTENKYFLPPKLARMQVMNRYIQDLKAETGYYWGWIANKLAENIDCEDVWEMLRFDERVADCASHSALKACGRQVEVICDLPPLRRLLELQTSNIKNYLKGRKALLEKSMVYGAGIARKEFEDVEDFELGVSWHLIKKLKEVDIRRLRLERETPKMPPYWTLWHPLYDQYVILEDRAKSPDVIMGGALQDFIWLINDFEESEAYFMGKGHILTQLIYLKNELKKNWAELAGYWSKPFILAKMNMEAVNMDANMDGINNIQEAIEIARRAFNKRRVEDNIILMDIKEDIVIKEMGSIGDNIIEGFIEWIDKAIDRLFYSSTLTTNTDGKGSYALSDTHKEEADHNVFFNNSILCEALKYQLYLDTVYRNQKQLRYLGVDVNRITVNDFKIRLV